MSTPRRRAFARLSRPHYVLAAHRLAFGGRPSRVGPPVDARGLVQRLFQRSDAPGPGTVGRELALALRTDPRVKRLRTLRPGDPAPLLIRLVRHPFALRTTSTVRRRLREVRRRAPSAPPPVRFDTELEGVFP